MNIKSLTPQPVLSIDPKNRVETGARTQSSADRDADGRREREQSELKRHLSDDEFQEALKALEAHPGLKSNHLTLKVEQHEDHRVVLIQDPLGNIVRRLSESQLWAATRDKDRSTGRILDKAM